jgi:hypothetical protein
MNPRISLEDRIETDEVVGLYKANGWSSADKPEKLIPALQNSDALVTARISGKLVGIGNAISDGSLVVYYPHMFVHPDYKNRGIDQLVGYPVIEIMDLTDRIQIPPPTSGISLWSTCGI